MKKYAIVTVVFKDHEYIEGAKVLAYSAKLTKSDRLADLVCMITPDIKIWLDNHPNQNKLFKALFNYVVEVPYIKHDVKKFFSNKLEKNYGHWINVSFTKWNCLSLVQYEKVLFSDADQIIIRDISEIWKLNTPAASFGFKTSIPSLKYLLTENEIKSIDQIIITPERLNKHMDKNSKVPFFTLGGQCILLKPSMEDYKGLIKMINKEEIYGYPNSVNGADEQSIAQYYIEKKVNIYTLNQSYSFTPWAEYSLKGKVEPKIIHYLGDKPWKTTWSDMKLWHDLYNRLKREEYNINFDLIKTQLKCKSDFDCEIADN